MKLLLLLLLLVMVHCVRLQSERQLKRKLWSQLLDVLVMLQIGIVGVLKVQREQTLRARREVDVGLRMHVVFRVMAVQVIVEIVIAAGELDLLLLIVLVLLHHRMNAVGECWRSERRRRQVGRFVLCVVALELFLAVRRRQSLPRECIDEQRMLLEVLLDGVLLRKDARAIRRPLFHRRAVATRQIIVHDIRVGRTEQHQAAAVVVVDDVRRLRVVLAILHVVHLLVSVVVEREVGRARRRHGAAAPVVVRRVDRVILARTETQYCAHGSAIGTHDTLPCDLFSHRNLPFLFFFLARSRTPREKMLAYHGNHYKRAQPHHIVQPEAI